MDKDKVYSFLLTLAFIGVIIGIVLVVCLLLPDFNGVVKIIIYNDNFEPVREFIGDIDLLHYGSQRIEFLCDGVKYSFYNVRFEIVK